MNSAIILDLEFNIIVDSITGYDPGVRTGPPERCYPPEGGEVEWHVDEDYPGAEFIQAAIDNNDTWYDIIATQILEDSVEEPEPPEPWDD